MNFTQLVLALLMALTALFASVSGSPEANPDPFFKYHPKKKGHHGHHHRHHGYGHGHYYRPVYHYRPVYYHHHKKW
ncbi:hypothetical protein Pmani_025374 [Petrolisthes manimaculis]|uniref:Uncharacterized protein n=1 Tax=Petrolisthes manimaculis TaxID=1843537 RepID=A0AAE1U184_9EUCA|nr:hypothetical protein Pmani_025374 [Petrolisthes manimaculis]